MNFIYYHNTLLIPYQAGGYPPGGSPKAMEVSDSNSIITHNTDALGSIL